MSRMAFLLIFMISLASCAGRMETYPADRFITPTVYFLPIFNVENLSCSGSNVSQFKTSDGRVIADVCKNQKKVCSIQGSCYLHDNKGYKLINYAKMVGDEVRFQVIKDHKCVYGLGSHSTCIDPYFSVAADLSIYPIGTVIYISVVRGLDLPNGEKHTGYFIVRDEGGGIKGPGRFDFFTGVLSPDDPKNSLAQLGLSDPQRHFEYQVVGGDFANQIRKSRNFPVLKPAVLEQGLKMFGF